MAGVAARSQLRAAMKRRAAETGGAASSVAKSAGPLAREAGDGGLQCAACGVKVRAAAAWAAHCNSRAHRARLQQLRDQLAAPAAPPPAKRSRTGPLAQPTPPVRTEQPVLQNKQPLPVPKQLETDEVLPEGFFDDPIMDAKARNIPHKDPIEEEWEKFQKVMKEETNLSAAIIAGEQEEATAERQIDEIEEQIRNLSKVLDLTRKKEEAAKQKQVEENMSMETNDASSDDDDDFEEYLDWRAKKSYR